MCSNSAECRDTVSSVTGGGSLRAEEQPETATMAPRDATTDPKHVAPPSASWLNGLTESYAVWFAALVLLLAVGKWKYDAYMDFMDRDLLQTRYTEYLIERWSREGDELLANVSLDPSFTRYKERRIYFRALTRKVPIPGTTPVEFKIKIGLPEVDDDNRWRGDDDEPDDKWRELRSKMRCVSEGGSLHFHNVGFLSNGVRFTSTYASGAGAVEYKLDRCVSCLQKIVPLMCTGDKWAIVCPPDEAYGDAGKESVPPGATTVWRISIESVDGNKVRGRREAEELLTASVTHTDGTPPMTRKRLFEKSKNHSSVLEIL
ncbi:FKBP-type peptidyl-prolyl cis-trans isomerase [Trypanosoma rangeli]|uniref:peptidylprolyl isomerase n=1 Tax=Trypanosoma rangeli TaxID=5698 RepID=A0A3R7NDK1_TRYRA|nr:FKBP-type peptidyl-prolyl cis-trans isomerase [Trypanosoma rangeli]RNF04862.1 FKBP-type peptidyl-prolyl cis-trans isomerase [Trypanosoma rangeli]|eukprot:RNF04862.1 FKBP-type peptidyl-prolyl cis-trans isomerase [Trypanosoma rangeli]